MKRNIDVIVIFILMAALAFTAGCAPIQQSGAVTPAPAQTQAAKASASPPPQSAATPSAAQTVAEEEYFDVDDAEAASNGAELEKYLNKANTYKEGDPSLRDFYGTDPVPDGMPQPIEPDGSVNKDSPLTCTLLIECSSILNNIDKFNADKLELLSADGTVYAAREVTFYEGESVFDLLLRETQNERIHMEFESVPGYNSNYIEGINNIYEYDCGELSGWMYSVNGWFPNYGSSRYQLQPGDSVEWHYTCDLGRDFGVTWERPR